MNNLKWLWIVLLCCSSVYNISAQQIVTDTSSSLESLVQSSLGQGCVEISNVSSSVNGLSNGINSYGTFDKADSNFPFQNGIILSTGSIESAGNSVITSSLNEGNSNWTTDADLENTLGITNTLNATVIEFDFISAADQIAFNYILASEEYNTNFPCQYSDGFAFLIKKANTPEIFENIALVPGSNTPVNTSTIHEEVVGFCDGQNEEFFEGYNIGDTNYNGRTTVLTARADITPNVLYRVKLIIADQTDGNYDSAVFIEDTSTIASLDLGPDIDLCAQSVLLNGAVQNDLAMYQWYRDDMLIPGAVNPLYQTAVSGTYRIEVTLPINNTSCVVEDEIVINLSSEQEVAPISDFVLCDDPSNDGQEIFDLTTMDDEIIAAVPEGNYNVSYHLSAAGAVTQTSTITVPWANLSNPQTIYVRVVNTDTGCLAYTSFDLIVNPAPDYTDLLEIIVCDDNQADGITTVSFEHITETILTANPNYLVTYYTTLSDAVIGEFPIGTSYTTTGASDMVFIRLDDSITSCSNILTLDITVLENPVLNLEVQWINACEMDDDGFELFDITSVTDDILQGLGGVTVEFYETIEDANAGINQIPNPSSYQNIVQYFQFVYIKVVNNTTGCTSIMPIELHTNVVESGFNTDPFGICDDESNDGIADFDLNEVESDMLLQYIEWEIEFFETEAEQLSNTNAIDKSVDYTATSILTTLYFSATLDNCTQYDTIDLVIHPAIEIQPLDTVEFCDTDFDGITSIVLSSFNDYVSEGIDSPAVTYYETEQDAITNVNPLSSSGYTNAVNPVTVYVRVLNTLTRCFDISALEILVIDPPIVSQPSDIIICDNDFDGFYEINLNNSIPEIVADPSDLIITFHTSYDDADNGTNPIPNPEDFNTNSKPIHVRVESLITTCHSIVELNVIVNTLPQFVPIEVFEACESDGDGFSDFIFNVKDDEILNGQLGKDVLYFETQQDAIDRTNIIDKTAAYQNLSNPQIIYARVENLTDIDCFDVTSFEIKVTQFVTFNQPNDIDICDDNSNDGFELLNLSEKIQEISNGINLNLDISFHLSFQDADNDLNELPLSYVNAENPQLIYVRIENDILCPAVADFTVNIVQVPEINPAPDIIECDEDYDGLTIFDITQVETDVLDVRVDDTVITYHESLNGVETNSEVIVDPENYMSISNPQTVYIKITNTLSNCYSYEPINLSANLPPPVNDFINYDICFNATSSFYLGDVNTVAVNDDTDVLFSYHSTFDDAQNNSNPLNLDYTYITFSDAIFVRVAYETTGCFYVYPFQLIVNPLPIANQPDDLEACDDDSNDQIAQFNLPLASAQVIGNQDPNLFSVSYYVNSLDAETGSNPLGEFFTGQHNQTIYARIENNITGCYEVTSFELIVNPHPFVPEPLVNCDYDYDGLTTFDLTLAESDLFVTANPDHSISYFETMADLENGTNNISDPTLYNNVSNPQTVFIKVFNPVANCYTSVPLELQANLPPAIDAQPVFEVCETDTGIVDLSEITESLLLQTINTQIVYYPSELDAINQTNTLNNSYNYQTFNDMLFARIEFTTTHCYHIHEFSLLVNPLPIANPVNNLETCDDDYDGFFTFNLAVQNNTVLGAQNPGDFIVTYYNDLQMAENGNGALNNSYSAYHNQTIYIRVEHIITGCYDITSFQTIIRPIPYLDIGNQVVCLDNLPLTVSAETNVSGDSYLWSTGDTSAEIEITNIGTYSVTVTSSEGCENTETFEVIESQSANIVVAESIDFSDPNNIVVTIEGIGDYLYQLDDLDPQTSNVFTNVSLGYHTITILDLNGCDSATKDIVVIDTPKFMTPNDDGHFDTWHITGVETLPGTIIYIFDRYGKLVKTLTSESPGWNGYYNGNLMPASDYWFVAKVKRGLESFEVKGHFTLRY